MDVCHDIEAVEQRLLPYVRPPPPPQPLRHSLEVCIDGEPGRSETLADRARRCLVADPYDPDAAHLLGLLGTPDDAPLLVVGALRGLREGGEALHRLGGPLADDIAAWVACVRGGAWSPLLRRGPPLYPAPHGLPTPADRARSEALAAEPSTPEGWTTRMSLYAASVNEWPVPEQWVRWAREDYANGVRDAATVIARVDGLAAVGGHLPRAKGGAQTHDPEVPGPVEMAALLAAPRPTFPPAAYPPRDRRKVRTLALALLDDDPAAGLSLLGFVAEPADADRFEARLYGRDAVTVSGALARWRTDRAVDLLVEAARGPYPVPAMSALAASRTDRGWTAALASWTGRSALTVTGTVEGCDVAVRVWEAGLDAYLAPPCAADPALRPRIEAAADRGIQAARHALEGGAGAAWSSWEPFYDPLPAVRTAHLEALLASEQASRELLRAAGRSPWAVDWLERAGAPAP